MRRLVLSIGSVGLGQVLSIIQAIGLVPLFLHAWGVDGYGSWLAIVAATSYLALFDLGGQNHIANLLTIDFNRGDGRAFARLLSEAGSFYLVLTLGVLALLAFALLGAAPVAARLISLPTISAVDTWTALFLSASVLLVIPTAIYVSPYRATGHYVRGQMLLNTIRLFETLILIALLVLSASPVIYAFGLAVTIVIRAAIFTFDEWRHIPYFCDTRISLSRAWQGRVYLKGSFLFWVMSVATTVNQRGVLTLVAVFVGPRGVAEYSTHRTLAGLVGYVAMLIQMPLWSEFTHLWAQGRRAQMRRLALISTRAVALASGLVGLVLWTTLPVIYPLWTRHALNIKPGLLLVLLVQAVLAGAWSTAGWSLLAANEQRRPALWSLANAGLTIGLAAVLAHRFQENGVAIGSLAADLVCGLLVFPTLAARFHGMLAWRWHGEIWLAMLAVAALAAAVVFSQQHLLGWARVLVPIVIEILWAMLSAPLFLDEAGRRRMSAALRSRLRRTLRHFASL